MNKEKRARVKILPSQFGCSESHFNSYIKDKSLLITKEYSSMITVVDEKGEEWNLFNGNYTIATS